MTVVACNYPSPSERPELEPARKVKERERQVRGRSAKAPPTLDADVHQELEATDALLGDPDAVRAFVFDAAQRLTISVTVDKHPDVFRVTTNNAATAALPEAIRFALPSATDTGWLVSFDSRTPQGQSISAAITASWTRWRAI